MQDLDAAITRRALNELLAPAGLESAAQHVEFSHAHVALKTRFFAAEAASAALAATGVVAGMIQNLRNPAPAPLKVSVDTALAEMSLISFALQRFLDPEKAPEQRLDPTERTAAAGFYKTADDRFVYLHSGFPDHPPKMLALLGCDDTQHAVAATIRAQTGRALEQKIVAAGLCGALLRTAQQWDASNPGRLLGSHPVVEVMQVGDSPAKPFPAGNAATDSAASAARRALAGIHVLDLTRVLAGPTCARTLASYGASALRIGAQHLPTIPLFMADTGLGKQSCFLDLTRDADRTQMDRLLLRADVFSQGYRSGAMERLGYGVNEVVAKHPGIIYVSINCYGHDGDWRTRPGWEQLAQTVTGLADLHGRHLHGDDQHPSLQPAAVTDYTTGYLAAYGVLAALLRRSRSGGSYWVKVSLARTGMWLRSLGLRDAMPAATMPNEETLARWYQHRETLWGPLLHLKPAVRLSNCNVEWKVVKS